MNASLSIKFCNMSHYSSSSPFFFLQMCLESFMQINNKSLVWLFVFSYFHESNSELILKSTSDGGWGLQPNFCPSAILNTWLVARDMMKEYCYKPREVGFLILFHFSSPLAFTIQSKRVRSHVIQILPQC